VNETDGSVAIPPAGTRPARLGTLDRALAAIPVASIVIWLSLVYMWESLGRSTPTVFIDELKWAQLSRGVAATGRAMQRGHDAPFGSLLSYVIAPAWWLGDTAQAYDAAKYITVVVMCLAAVPAYLLARRLLDSKPLALAVAAASISIPSMAYALYLIPEPVAYPWATLCAFLIVGALAVRSPRWIAAAVVASAIAPAVRTQLVVVPAAFALSALGLWWLGPRGRRLRARWSRTDTVAFAVLCIGAFVVLNRWFLHGVDSWTVTTQSHRGWIFHHIVWSLGALAIGTGILPLVGAVIALVPRRDEPRSPWQRAFLAVLLGYAVTFGLYTGVKAAFLQSLFATRVTERNMIYVAPLLFVATAVALERRRVRLWTLALGIALVSYLVVATPSQLDYPYFEALGFSLMSVLNRELFWNVHALDLALYVTLAIVTGLWLLAWALRTRPLEGRVRVAATSVTASAAVVLIAWNLAGQIGAADGAAQSSDRLYANLQKPPNWIDKDTGGAKTTYLGMQLQSDHGQGANLLEFWNRSIVNVWSLDGSAPEPGPTLSPDLAATDGTLWPSPETPYLVADTNVDPAGTPLDARGPTRLYRLDGPIRLRSWRAGIEPDGWMLHDSAYSRFGSGAGPAGTLVISLSRATFCPDPTKHIPEGQATIRVGRLAVVDHQPGMGAVQHVLHRAVPNCKVTTVRVPVAPPPLRVEVHMDGTFRPNETGGNPGDSRDLGAVVDYRFVPER
jgi:hypothetical protein